MDRTGKLNYIELGIDDMTNLVELSDESLLYNLQTRYSQKMIYTYIGSILISINPYTELDIYGNKQIAKYQNKSMQQVPPHLFGIAEINYSKMMMENENQVIVISGESGAGKTESFKRLLRYLAYTSGGVKELQSSDRELSNDVANKILDSTPLLESFGNAKTIRNDNSSRFGKYVEIFFENGTICGSRTTNYLLEKSRIVNINPEERGYHIFYELLQGLDSFGKSQYYLKNVSDYVYLNNARDFTVKGRDDARNLKDFMGQWSTMGLTNDDLDVALRIISAVLHLGNIKFGQQEDVSHLLETENVNIVAKMLKVDCASLINCLTMKTTDTVKDIASSPVSAEQAANLRDTLAKHLYSELFDWIVAKVNESLNEKTATLKRTSSHLDRSMTSSTSKFRSIAMLDIYGFENFPENSLEQLCINYANETLQQFFNRYVFELEQAEYKQEGISWHYVTYPDNQPIINLLSAMPSGIIQILNDECSIPQGSDEAFLTKCHNVHQRNANFEKPKKVHPPQFIIRHFAGNIFYNVTGFLEKNRDIIRKDAIRLIEHCEVKEIAAMFRKKKERTLKNPNVKARTPAVMADFQNSLVSLLNKMKTCQPWFIRCLKPNKRKEPLYFDKDIVMDQMRYTGILETVKIRKSGFPIRILFQTFLSRFYLLQSGDMRRFAKKEPQEACLKMLPKFGGQKSKEFEVGKTKLFLKENFARYLESQVRIIRERSAIKIQRKWRAYWKVREIIVRNRAATKLQAIARGFIERRRIRRLHVAIVKLQAYVRMQLVRQKFLEEHPEFAKYSFNHVDNIDGSKSSAIAYKFPVAPSNDHSKKRKGKPAPMTFNYNHLKIPMKLAFLLENSNEYLVSGEGNPTPNFITKTSRAQHLYNRDEFQLPDDIDDYLIEEFVESFGNDVALESKARPIQLPFLLESMSSSIKEDCLNAHRLLLRLLYVNSMSWTHQYLAGSYLSYMASVSSQMQLEIIVQIIAETLNPRSDGPKPFNKHTADNVDNIRVSRAWTLLANLLSHIILIPTIFNYVLKYVSSSFGIDQAATCQEKMLQFINENCVKVPRLFPASQLEWRANLRGTKTSLKAVFADDVNNSVHLHSFTNAEIFANHSLCFRFNKFRLNRGWSISLISEDMVIDCGGHNYLLDVISGLELPRHWAEIVGYGIENKFLVSKFGKVVASNTVTSQVIRSQLSRQNIRYADGYDAKSTGTVTSRKSMDSWVDRYFEKSFKNEVSSPIGVQNYIHGLEDDLKVSGNANLNTEDPTSSSQIQIGMPGFMPLSPAHTANPQTYNSSSSSHDRRYLEDQLHAAELQKQLYQTSIENEMLQKRLLDLKQQNTANSSVPKTTPQPSPHHRRNDPIIGHIGWNDMVQTPIDEIHLNNGINQTIKPHSDQETESRPTRRFSKDNASIEDQEKIAHLKKRRSIVKYSEVSPASNIVVDDSSVLPEVKENDSVPLSQLRAAEIPKVNVANRTAFLDKFFLDKKIQSQPTSHVATKRKAPLPPIESDLQPTISVLDLVPTPVPRSNVEHVTATHPLIPPRNLLPRPSIHVEQRVYNHEDDHEDNHEDNHKDNYKDDHKDNLKEDHVTVLSPRDKHLDSVDFENETVIVAPVPVPEIIKKRRQRRITSSKKAAIILSGMTNLHYYTYTNVPWFLMVKIELFLPKEIRDLTILNPIIFCQIVRDLTEFPCIRWVGSERAELTNMLRSVDTTRIQEVLAAPSDLMLAVIDRVQHCELYFSRFYAIEWLSANTMGLVCHWLAISHSGVRFVEQSIKRPDSGLKVVCRVEYKDIRTMICEDYDEYANAQKLIMKTSAKKRFEILSPQVLSAMNLIQEFMDHCGYLKKQSTTSTPSYVSRKGNKSTEDEVQCTSMVTTLDVHNRRIPVIQVLDHANGSFKHDNHPSSDPCGDLVDFMVANSKHKFRDEVDSSVLRWQSDPINAPLLPTLNHHLAEKAISTFNAIRCLSGDLALEHPSNEFDYGSSIFKTLIRSRELIEEVVLQIMKQIIGNDKPDNRLMLWNLLSTIIMFFGVSKRMDPFLRQHLKMMVQDQSNPDQSAIISTLKVSQKASSSGPRKELPSQNEIRLLLTGVSSSTNTIHIPGTTVDCNIRFNSSVGGVIRNLCQSLDVTVDRELVEYSMAMIEVNDSKEAVRVLALLEWDLYFFDVVTSVTKINDIKFIIYISRSSWTCPIIPSQKSDSFIDFIFNQLCDGIFTEKWFSSRTNDTKLLRDIAAISFFNFKGQGYDGPLTEDILRAIVPDEVLTQTHRPVSRVDLLRMISSVPDTIDVSNMASPIDYRRKFLELALQLPLYGWISFPIYRLNYHPSSNNLAMNFTPASISITNHCTSERILKIPITSLSGFHFSAMDSTSSQFVLRYDERQEIQFVADNSSKLVFLLNQYHKIRSLLANRRC